MVTLKEKNIPFMSSFRDGNSRIMSYYKKKETHLNIMVSNCCVDFFVSENIFGAVGDLT